MEPTKKSRKIVFESLPDIDGDNNNKKQVRWADDHDDGDHGPVQQLQVGLAELVRGACDRLGCVDGSEMYVFPFVGALELSSHQQRFF